ncbi:glycerol-3-phosphate 1-O-acyltransferase PlsB [Pleionea litopenaei]|uniref:Glycerol-3-phosphate acyltransferase n=1 Tax=Pleionea litopenaei TaxID=3070815 RepID=A0AA51RRX2_9GAMM|nr:glycerol-3-phosphate 1-O-acyltransferase PlsB [Pleionea sp. HL-JVS1]WMS86420.1 glycerol-3-phosphate 1-O-acyltransferase PlsB [Pleionea sp. HL-JVS1]
MLGLRHLYFNLVKLPLKWLVKVKTLPENPIESLDLDTTKPIYYVMRTRSTSSFLMLQQECEKHGLPQPNYLSSNQTEVPNGGAFFIQHKQIFGRRPSTITKYANQLEKLLEQHQDNVDDIQLVPVSIYWGRNPGKEKSLLRLFFTDTESATPFRKFLILLFQGRNSFINFGRPLQLARLGKSQSAKVNVLKIVRTLRVYFHRQWIAAMGPLVANRKQMITSLMADDKVIEAIKREQKKKNLTYRKAQKLALKYADEIASSYSYKTVRFMSTVLSWLWNKMYGGIKVQNAERVRELASDHEIVYVPCHRSHIDYLLLSYVLYYEGLVPPHIAAGINLNFWPIGSILRRGGAFFIRRSFSGNKLYTAVFNAYFHSLLNKGIPVEFFPEGGRSRTGRLLQPKTGMMSMMIQNFMRGCRKPIMVVPVYVGYERMMEGKSYVKEMQGAQKKKESMGQLLKVRNQLKQRYGKVYVNFADPINLESWLSQSDENWRSHKTDEKPAWLSESVSNLGELCMTRINQSTVVNCVNLTSLILLSTQRRTLGKQELASQLELYLKFLKELPYHQDINCAYDSAKSIIDEAKLLGALNEFENPLGNLCQITERSAVLMTYYRNNIIHLFALPALIASHFRQKSSIKKQQLIAGCKALYPLLKRELFLSYSDSELNQAIDQTLSFFDSHGLLEVVNDDILRPKLESEAFSSLMLLADTLRETLERYGITLTLLATHAGVGAISRAELENQSQKLAQRIAALYSIYAPEAFDKSLFQQIVSTLRQSHLITNGEGGSCRLAVAYLTYNTW